MGRGKLIAAEEAKTSAGITNTYGIADQVFEELTALAKMSDSFDDFLQAAYDLDEIIDPKVQVAVDDEVKGIYGASQ